MSSWTNWAQQLLQYCGWPGTAENVKFLQEWQVYEGGTAQDNALEAG